MSQCRFRAEAPAFPLGLPVKTKPPNRSCCFSKPEFRYGTRNMAVPAFLMVQHPGLRDCIQILSNQAINFQNTTSFLPGTVSCFRIYHACRLAFGDTLDGHKHICKDRISLRIVVDRSIVSASRCCDLYRVIRNGGCLVVFLC